MDPHEAEGRALIPIAEATNGVRSRVRPGAFTFPVLPQMRRGALINARRMPAGRRLLCIRPC